jgi:putative PEP-CTERM system TPR-repeat lipoprotein
MASARNYTQKQEYPAAIIQLKAALAKRPESREARLLLGRSLLETGSPAPAAIELRKALELGASASEVQPLLAKALLAQGETQLLLAQFAAVELNDAAANADLKTTVATVLAVQGEKARALEMVNAALQANPNHAPAILLVARINADNGDFQGALDLLEKVLATDPTHLSALLLKGDFQRTGLRDPNAAMVTVKLALQGNPRSVLAAVAVINSSLQLEGPSVAKKHLDALMAIHPQHPQTMLLQAQFAFAEGDAAKTREITEQLLRTMPDDVQLLQLAGMNELRLNSLNQAETYLLRVLKFSPQSRPPRQLLAGIYNRIGEPAKALAQLRPLIGADSADSASLTLAGEAFMQLGDVPNAEKVFSQATRGNPRATTARSALALAQLGRGNTNAAMTELEAAAATETGFRSSLALIAARIRINDVPGALKAIDALEKKQPDKPLAYALRATTLLQKRDVPGATENFEKALNLDPLYYPATAGLAKIEFDAGRPDGAKKRFENLLLKDPRNTRVLLGLADLKARTGGSKDEVTAAITAAVKAGPEDVRARLLLINHLLGHRDTAGALVAAQGAGTALPNNPEVLDALGMVQIAAGQTQQAVSTFGRLLSMRPDKPELAMRLADAYMASKDLVGVKRSLSKALEMRPDFYPAQRSLVRLAVQQMDEPEALRISRTIQKQQPKDSAGYLLESDVALASNNPGAAVAPLREALARDGSSSTAISLHTALDLAKRAPEAERHASTWAKEHPRDSNFLFYLGGKALMSQDYRSAESYYQKVLAIEPKQAMALNNLAWLMARSKRPGALSLAEKAYALLPEELVVMDTLAYLLALDKQFDRALEMQKRVLARKPQDQGFRLTLAKIYLETGDKAQARTELEALLKLGDKLGPQAEVKQLLSTI